MRLRAWIVALLLALAASACGGGDEPSDEPTDPSDGITILGPAEEDAGLVPEFEWAPVNGAAAYRLVLVGPEGLPVWAWVGDETSVILGGHIEERPPEMVGPVVEDGSSWTVAALDASGDVIVVSDVRPVSAGVELGSGETVAPDETDAPEPSGGELPISCSLITQEELDGLFAGAEANVEPISGACEVTLGARLAILFIYDDERGLGDGKDVDVGDEGRLLEMTPSLRSVTFNVGGRSGQLQLFGRYPEADIIAFAAAVAERLRP